MSEAFRVVIADDASDFRFLLRRSLSEHPRLEVVGEAGDGDEAITAVAAADPDALVLDLAMPNKDGYQVLEELRPRMPQLAIVVLSGLAHGYAAGRALDLGADAYVEKGGRLDAITETLVAAIDARRSAQPLATNVVPSATDVDTAEIVTPLDPRWFRVLIDSILDYSIIGLDPNGIVASWNKGAERLKGYRGREIIGQHLSIFYPPEDRDAGVPDAMLQRAANEGHSIHSGWRLRKDGTRFWGDVVVTALRSDDGTLTGFAKVTRDLTERHAAEQRLYASEERFRVLVESVVDYAIIGLDPTGVITSWNRGAERLKGYRSDEIVGQHISAFYPEAEREAGLPMILLDRARNAGHAVYSGWRVRKDGTRFWGDIVVTSVLDHQGTLIGFAKVTRDMTERHLADEASAGALEREREATLRLAEVNRMQDQFLTAVSHDLKAPLTAVGGFAELLFEEKGDEPQAQARRQLAARILANVERMRTMVSDLLEVTRLEAHAVTIQRRPTDLSALLTAIASDLRPALGSHAVELSVPDGVKANVDPHAIDRVVTNLLTNAARFSPVSKPVELRLEETPEAFVVHVRDHGSGIAEESLDRIFERYVQVHAHPLGSPGTGVGLTIARTYVEMHGGRITVTSAPGEGSTFSFTIPREVPAAEA